MLNTTAFFEKYHMSVNSFKQNVNTLLVLQLNQSTKSKC